MLWKQELFFFLSYVWLCWIFFLICRTAVKQSMATTPIFVWISSVLESKDADCLLRVEICCVFHVHFLWMDALHRSTIHVANLLSVIAWLCSACISVSPIAADSQFYPRSQCWSFQKIRPSSACYEERTPLTSGLESADVVSGFLTEHNRFSIFLCCFVQHPGPCRGHNVFTAHRHLRERTVSHSCQSPACLFVHSQRSRLTGAQLLSIKGNIRSACTGHCQLVEWHTVEPVLATTWQKRPPENCGHTISVPSIRGFKCTDSVLENATTWEMRIADTKGRPKASIQPEKSDHMRQIERKALFCLSNFPS